MLRVRRHPMTQDVPRALQLAHDDSVQNFGALRDQGCGMAVRIAGLAFTATVAKQVAHKLGRVPTGWRVTRARGAAARLYESTTAEPDSNFITLTSETTCTVDVEVW